MGEKRNKKVKFLEEHPKCIYCGGAQDSETIDHMPPKIFFDNSHRPKGYEFPACRRCNNETGRAEQIVALQLRGCDENANDLPKLFSGVENNTPAVISNMTPSQRDKRNFIKKLGLRPGVDMSSADVPLMKLDLESFKLVGRKLTMALHYHHTRQIVPPTGFVGVRWMTLSTIDNDGDDLQAFIDQLGPTHTLSQGAWNTIDQFAYRPSFSDDGNVSFFVAKFRGQIWLNGMVHCQPPNDDSFAVNGKRGFRPFHCEA